MSGGGGGGGAMTGGAIGAMGSLMEANDTKSAYDHEADELEANARYTRLTAKFNADRQQMIAGKKIGGMSSDYAASGVSSESASVLAVIGESRANAELDRLSIMHGGEIRAGAMEQRAQRDRDAGNWAMQVGYFKAFTSFFGGMAKGSQQGLFDKAGTNAPGGGGGENKLDKWADNDPDPDGWRYSNTGMGAAWGPEYFGKHKEYV